jgi:hypothetical protein
VSTPLNLLDSAALLGGYRYVELSCFARLGARAPEAPPALAGYLAGAARAHAYRAGLIEARLPVSVGLPHAGELTVAPDADTDALLDAIFTGSDARCCEVLGGALYPSMLAGYRAHLDRCSPFADPPVSRLLSRLVADLEAVAADGASVGEPARGPAVTQVVARLSARGGIFLAPPGG